MSSDPSRRARTMEQAAWSHLQVFTQPVWSWPPELAKELPAFEDLYVAPARTGRGPDPITALGDLLRNPRGPSKVILTGQRGSGKSWGLKWLAQSLGDRFAIVQTSATDITGVTLPDADVGTLLLLICERLASLVQDVASLDAAAGGALRAWLVRLSAVQSMPEAPRTHDGNLELGVGALGRWFAKVVLRLRSDAELRKQVREAPADDLIVVTDALLGLVRKGRREPLVVLDDVDKVNLESARRIFFEQYGVLARLNTRLVLTCPVSLALDGVAQATGGTMPVVFLRNVKVVDRKEPRKVIPAAVDHFRSLLGHLMDPGLVEDAALVELTRLSGGVTREFGQLLARAAVVCHYDKLDHIDVGAVEQAALDARIELERATQDKEIRERLSAVHRLKQMETAVDRRLLDRNMILEYVNGGVWHDVHPLLAEVVEAWGHS